MTWLRPHLSVRAAVTNALGLEVSPEVARAQLTALRQRVPYLYAILVVNVSALCFTHLDTNPLWQVVVLPSILILFIASRLIWWINLDVAVASDADVARCLSSTAVAGIGTGVFILVWAISLHRSDSELAWSVFMTENGHVDFFIGITVVSCIFLLMHLRRASILLALIIVGPFATYLLATGRPIESAIALNLILVTAAMLYVAVSFARDFERMVVTGADLERLSVQNARLAASDMMTNLPNRRRFFHELEQAGLATPFAVLVLDLDGFKQVNDVYGHNAGDDVLRAVATRLLDVAPTGACLARLGGDEFACLLAGELVGQARTIGEAMIAACSTPIDCTSFTANIGASAGICQSQGEADAPLAVYERADYALFQAKRAGRGRVETFSGQHDHSIRRHSSIAHLLRSADLHSELSTVYQPVVAVGDHRITSFEALIRWTSRELGPVGPEEFIPIAERTDLIFDMSRHVLRDALDQAVAWPDHISIKVNLSVRDLLSSGQTEALGALLVASKIHASRVTFEVTETIFAESLELVRSNVAVLRTTGCKIAIDDFGIGYSNLNYIHALSPDIIKIDRCFVEGVATHAASQRIIRTIIELARNVGAKSVAEGVETLEQARLLAELGCDELQGYYFSKPVCAAAAAAMAAQGATVRPAFLISSAAA